MSFASSLFAVAYGPTQSISSDGWISSMFGGLSPTYTGKAINEQVALQMTAIYRSVALISDAVAVLPVSVFQRVGDRREPRPDHPVTGLLRRPNALMSSVSMRCAGQAHCLQYGNSYVDIQRTQGGDPVALWPLLPDRTTPITVDEMSGERRIAYRTLVDGKEVVIGTDDVLHIQGMSFDGIRGYSPISLARQAIGLALGLEEFGGKFFGNDAKSGGFLEHPGSLSDEARVNLSRSFDAQGGLTNAHRTKILEEGMKFNATSISPEDSQFLATRSFQVEEIARLYGVPLHMLQSQAKSTSWGSGIAQMSLGFLIYTVQPWLTRWEQEYERKLLTPAELATGHYIKFNVNALLRADAATRGSFYTAALNRATGWMERDEVRSLEDLNPDGIENEAASAPSPPTPFQRTDPSEPGSDSE